MEQNGHTNKNLSRFDHQYFKSCFFRQKHTKMVFYFSSRKRYNNAITQQKKNKKNQKEKLRN
jgi:hypothetical protein